ncbi:MAG: hypothetical protein AAB834_03040 [Patescibacteria group bacterium]
MTGTLAPTWYIDIREPQTSEHISLDLTRHLPRRLAVGPAVIVSDRPAILLPVIRKRWMKVIREVERHLSSTLDPWKKCELACELERMRSFCFTTDISAAQTDALIIAPFQTVCDLPYYSTLYILASLTPDQFLSIISYALPSSLVAVYGEWTEYEQTLRDLCAQDVPQYGEGAYPIAT